MRCADVDQNLLRYAEHAMGRWKAFLMREHIARCERCQARLADIQSTGAKLSAALREDIDAPDVADSVMALIAAESPRVIRQPRTAWALAASACAVTALAIYGPYCMRSTHRPTKPIAKALAGHYAHKPIDSPKPEPHSPEAYHQPRREGVELVVWRRSEVSHNHPNRRVVDSVPKLPDVPKPPADLPKEIDNAVASPQPSYVVVVAAAPDSPGDVELESKDTTTGSVTTYTRARDKNGVEQVMLIQCTPQTTDPEDTRI